MTKYGYLYEKRSINKQNKTYIDPYTPMEIKDAITKLQYGMYIYPVTGKVDQQTIKVMRMPRCGVNDHVARDLLSVMYAKLTPKGFRKKNTLQSNIWRKHSYSAGKTYDWMLMPAHKSTKLDPNMVAYAIEYGINRWASVSNVMFRRVNQESAADLFFGFYKGKKNCATAILFSFVTYSKNC